MLAVDGMARARVLACIANDGYVETEESYVFRKSRKPLTELRNATIEEVSATVDGSAGVPPGWIVVR
jgi:hypothetical protein